MQRQTAMRGFSRREMVVAGGILTLVCDRYSVTLCRLAAPDRHWEVTWPRWVAMDLLRRFCGLSMRQIGRMFRRDHSAAVHAIKSVTEECRTYQRKQVEIAELEVMIRSDLKLGIGMEFCLEVAR
jgi:chromosomal replication initiation ATPase DnaA